jgi:hypothetical protein
MESLIEKYVKIRNQQVGISKMAEYYSSHLFELPILLHLYPLKYSIKHNEPYP